MGPAVMKNIILVVADESDTRIFLSNLLSSVGFQPVSAINMPEGLETAKTRRPALIILDVMMAGKEGIRMYHHLKNDDTLKNIPVIMLSAIDRETFFLYEKFQSTRGGSGVPEPDAYLEKPPEAEDLLYLVQRLIENDRVSPDFQDKKKILVRERGDH